MKLEIDFENKTISILEKVNLKTLVEFLKTLPDWEQYEIKEFVEMVPNLPEVPEVVQPLKPPSWFYDRYIGPVWYSDKPDFSSTPDRTSDGGGYGGSIPTNVDDVIRTLPSDRQTDILNKASKLIKKLGESE